LLVAIIFLNGPFQITSTGRLWRRVLAEPLPRRHGWISILVVVPLGMTAMVRVFSPAFFPQPVGARQANGQPKETRNFITSSI